MTAVVVEDELDMSKGQRKHSPSFKGKVALEGVKHDPGVRNLFS